MIFVYILVALILILLLVAYFMPKSYNVERTVVIHEAPSSVMDKISDLNYYSRWNPWQQSDPTAKASITGTPKTAGHSYSWVGKKVGVGSLTLRSMDSKHIHFNLQFLRPWKSFATDNWLFEPWGDHETKVTWQDSGQLPWPMGRLMAPMIQKTLTKQFTEGLNNLKKLCEAFGSKKDL